MKIVLLLHSTTGNTRVVARFAAARLRGLGHECELVDVARHRAPPEPSEIDLLGVASPTMYFRPTWTMERAIARLPNAAPGGKPAFLLNTCGGMPGAHFAMLAELLAHKGYVTLGAHWTLAPSNWPVHQRAQKAIAATEPLSRIGAVTPRSLRPLWALLWESACHADRRDRDELVAFLEDMVRRAATGRLDDAPAPSELHVPIPVTSKVGRVIPREFPDRVLRFHADPARCGRCGTCVKVCAEGIVTRDADDEVPRFGAGCTGCYACFNRCPDNAVADTLSPTGKGQYPGPPRTFRDLFR